MPFYRIGGLMCHVKLSGKGSKNPPGACIGRISNRGIEQRCAAMSSFLCDWKLESGKTCDAPLCGDHAHQVGTDRHYCPTHRRQQLREDPQAAFAFASHLSVVCKGCASTVQPGRIWCLGCSSEGGPP